MQLARLARTTQISPTELLADPDVCEDLLDICHAEDLEYARRADEEKRLAFLLDAQRRFAEAAGRARH